jgi:hypothetical protein
MSSMYEMEIGAERRREVLLGSMKSGRHVARPTGDGSRVDHFSSDGLRSRMSLGLRLAGVAGIAIAALSQII